MANPTGLRRGVQMFLLRHCNSIGKIRPAELVKHALEVVWLQALADLGFSSENIEYAKEGFDRLSMLVYNSFPDLSVQDIELAMIMYMGEEFDPDLKPKDHFQSLSYSFVAGVLQAYRKQRVRALKEVQAQLPPPPTVETKVFDVLVAHIEFVTQGILPVYDLYSKGESIDEYRLLLPEMYWTLKGIGGFELSEEQQRDVQEQAKLFLKAERGLSQSQTSNWIEELKAKREGQSISHIKLVKKSHEIATMMAFDYFAYYGFNLPELMGMGDLNKEIDPDEREMICSYLKNRNADEKSLDWVLATIQNEIGVSPSKVYAVIWQDKTKV